MFKTLFEFAEQDINENFTTGMMIPAIVVGVQLMVTSVCMLETMDRAEPRPDAIAEQGRLLEQLPFDLPVATPRTVFSYDDAAGYQIPLSFEIPPRQTSREGDAYLRLRCRKRNVPDQVKNTEGIWIEGVLSGTTYPGFKVPDRITEDLSQSNTYFLRKILIACDGRWGTVNLSLGQMLEGSTTSVRDVLGDGRLDVVIADDIEIASASVCFRTEGSCTSSCVDYSRVK